jgi:hypothetical protein
MTPLHEGDYIVPQLMTKCKNKNWRIKMFNYNIGEYLSASRRQKASGD